MARYNVNPTRMELKKLKVRLKTAVRGHKLLKDKSDEMVRRFSVLLRENKRLREEGEAKLMDAMKEFASARAFMDDERVENAFAMPTVKLRVDTSTENIMNLVTPKMTVEAELTDGLPYAFSEVTSEADYSVRRISEALTSLVALAEVEKKVQMLAREIVKNKRRVNALEYVMIPDLEETIRYIADKLDENERSALTRLMKVKSMIEERG